MTTFTPDPTGSTAPAEKLRAAAEAFKNRNEDAWLAFESCAEMEVDSDWSGDPWRANMLLLARALTTPEPAVSPAPDTEARALVEAVHAAIQIDALTAAARRRSGEMPGWLDTTVGEDLEAALLDSVVERVQPLLNESAEREAGLRADLDRARTELAEIRAALVAADPKADLPGYAYVPSADIVREITTTRDTYFRNWEQARAERDSARAARDRMLSERAVAARAGARPLPDDAEFKLTAALVRRLQEFGAPLTDEQRPAVTQIVIDQFRRLRAGATPTTGPAPAAADVQWRILLDPDTQPWLLTPSTDAATVAGLLSEARRTRPEARAEVRSLGAWQVVEPAAPQAPAEPTATLHGLIDATRVVNLHRSTRCTGCNAADQWWCSCPEGYTPPAAPAAREDTAPPDDEVVTLDDLTGPECGKTGRTSDVGCDGTCAACAPDDYGDNLTAGFLRAPVGACSCLPTAVAIHVPGTYCGDAQYEELLNAVEAGAEDQSAAVHLVLNRLANPAPEEKQ